MPAASPTLKTRGRASSRVRWSDWTRLPEAELLQVRLCDLDVQIKGSALEPRLRDLRSELRAQGIRFRPYTWLSSDWFTPDGATGFAIPFFLAHPRLARLERKHMLEVEGGTRNWCMRLLRHEVAHALDNAYRLHWRKSWRDQFGKFSSPYLPSYRPNPASRNHVQNLSYWYAQSHPAEDYAETFAVWLDPTSKWRQQYANWPAIGKLKYVETLADELRSSTPRLQTKHREDPLSSLQQTLAEYYENKQSHYGDAAWTPLDDQLRRSFKGSDGRAGLGTFLERNRRRLVGHVATHTGQSRYLIDHALGDLIRRARILGLKRSDSEPQTLLSASVLLTASAMQFMHGTHPRYHR